MTLCESGAVRPTSPFAYLAAVLLVLAGWVGATAVTAGAWDTVRDSTLVPVTRERADAAGASLAVFTDIVQPARTVTCRGVDEKKKEVAIGAATIDMTVQSEGTTWHLINLLPDGRDGLSVRCTPRDRRVDNATYSFAVVDGFTSRGDRGQLLAGAGLLAGLALAGWTFHSRRRLKQSVTTSGATP